MYRRQYRTPKTRHGFTLIELLTVVAIIAILATMLIVGLRSAVGGTRAQATRATIAKVSGLLEQRLGAWNRIDVEAKFAQQIDATAGQLGIERDLATVLVKKSQFRAYFPQVWSEAVQLGATPPAKITPACESSEVLYWFLTSDQARMPGYAQEGTDNFTGATADTDNNGAIEFVDGWGNPLRFYRWPTRLIRPDGRRTSLPLFEPVTMADIQAARILMPGLPLDPIGHASNPAAPLSQDPDDPLGLVEAAYESQSPYFAAPAFEDAYSTVGTFHRPLIVSAGADRALGLYEPSDVGMSRGYWAALVPNLDYADDITNGQR